MRFPDPLLRGVLIRRYKRFLADVILPDGTAVTAHCPNPGSMMGLVAPDSEVWLSPARNPERKLRYTLELVRVADGVGESLVAVNTGLANNLAEEAIGGGRIKALAGYHSIRREVRYGQNSRIDLLLEADGRPPCYVEIKNVTLKRDQALPGVAEFPDAVTKRGAKHLRELQDMAAQGARAVMLYIVARQDCARFAVAEDIDPDYAAALAKATASGVEALCYGCRLSPEAVTVEAALGGPA